MTRITIENFRRVFDLDVRFHARVNYVLGGNGTGKTTFARLLVAAMQGDIAFLSEQDFSKIRLELRDEQNNEDFIVLFEKSFEGAIQIGDARVSVNIGRNQEPVDGTKLFGAEFGVMLEDIMPSRKDSDADLYVSTKNLTSEQIRFWRSLPISMRKSRQRTDVANNQRELVRRVFLTTKVKWIPIDRRTGAIEGPRADSTKHPLNVKITQIQNDLVRYFAELEAKKAKEFEQFRNNCFLTLLDVEASKGNKAIAGVEKISSLQTEVNQIIPELALNSELEAEFRHRAEVLFAWIKSRRGRPVESLRQAYSRLQEVVTYWQTMQENLSQIFFKRNEFIRFVNDAFALHHLKEMQRQKFAKKMNFESTNDVFFVPSFNSNQKIRLRDLSSGEKQFFIMLAEALLEREEQETMIIDEPELSLHITWQNRLVADLLSLNSQCQLILVTHSPDIVATKDHCIIEIENLTSLRAS